MRCARKRARPVPRSASLKKIRLTTFLSGAAAGYLFVVGANMFWGLNFVVAKIMSGVVPPVALSFWRWAVAALFLAPLLLKVWRIRGVIAENWLAYLKCAFTGVVMFHICIYIGANSSSTYSLALIAAFSGIFVKLIYVMLGRGVTLVQGAGGMMAVVGLLVLVARGDAGNLLELEFVAGDLWMLLGALVWGLYSIFLEDMPKKEPFTNHSAMVFIGLPILGLFYGIESTHTGPFEVNVVVIGVLVYLALFPSIVCYWFWIGAIERLGAVRTHALYYTLPLFASMEAWLILDEEIRLYHAAAAVPIITGAVLTAVVKR